MRKYACKIEYAGFSLVELLVVIAIMSIMTVIGFALLSSSKSDARLKAAQREVSATIKLAQSYALQGRKQGDMAPCGYGFRFDPSDSERKKYEIFYRLPGGAGGCSTPAGNTQMAYFNLNNVVFLADPVDLENTEMYFAIPFAGMVGPAMKTFTFQYIDQTKTITISSDGGIIEN